MRRETYPPIISKMPRLLHGGDYNPEQWPKEIRIADNDLMKQANWNAVSMGIFSWVSLELEEGKFTFEWLDEMMDMQAQNGRVVGLATPSAAAPAWLSKRYPETIRTGSDGVRRKHGNRVNYCWTSPIYRQKTSEMATRLAERYGKHPALAYWHVSNEFGGECHCDLCQEAFREWLKARYGSLDALNAAYWTAFWSHTFTDWSQLESPGEPHGETAIIGLTVDWRRFTSDRIIDFYLNETNALRAAAPGVPATTNLMGTYTGLDPFKIAPHVDFIAWDSYPWFGLTPWDVDSWITTSFIHDLNRGLKGGKPFLLMECSPSSSNWYPVMGLKRPNAHMLEGLQAIAHGADGVQYFQWRQGRGSSEQYHGAVVAHNNRTDARVFQEVAALGKTLGQLTPVAGAPFKAEVALIHDWESAWAIEATVAPRLDKKNYTKTVIEHYEHFWEQGIAVEVIDSECELSGYKMVIAPMLYMIKPGVAERLAQFVKDGGTLVTTYWSGWVDQNTLAFQGGYPEPLRSALGIRVEEIDALYPDQHNQVVVEKSGLLDRGSKYAASELCERVQAETAEVLAVYGEDFYAGDPALTRNIYGKGQAIYVASRNEDAFNRDLFAGLTEQLGIKPCVEGSWTKGVTVQCREGATADFLFVLNCTDKEATITLNEQGLQNAVDGTPAASSFQLPAFGSRVLIRSLTPQQPVALPEVAAPAAS